MSNNQIQPISPYQHVENLRNAISELSIKIGNINLLNIQSIKDLPLEIKDQIISSIFNDNNNNNKHKDLNSISLVCRSFSQMPSRMATIFPELSKKFTTTVLLKSGYITDQIDQTNKERIKDCSAFDFSGVSPDKIANLIKDFPKCTSLTLTSLDNLTSDHFPPLLEKLTIATSSINDESISKLKHLTNLKMLDISKNDSITGASFNSLPSSLEELIANGCSIKGRALINLQHLTNLKILNLSWNGTLGQYYKDLPTSLEEVVLNNCPYKGSNLAALRRNT